MTAHRRLREMITAGAIVVETFPKDADRAKDGPALRTVLQWDGDIVLKVAPGFVADAGLQAAHFSEIDKAVAEIRRSAHRVFGLGVLRPAAWVAGAAWAGFAVRDVWTIGAADLEAIAWALLDWPLALLAGMVPALLGRWTNVLVWAARRLLKAGIVPLPAGLLAAFDRESPFCDRDAVSYGDDEPPLQPPGEADSGRPPQS